MIVISKTLPGAGEVLDLYRRLPELGMVQSSIMSGQRYDRVESFDEKWSCPAVVWCSGGCETYELGDGSVVRLRVAGTMTIGSGERYSYRAAETAFLSNMIVFPRWMTEAVGASTSALRTRLIRPDRETESLMGAIASRCRAADSDSLWYREKIASLYSILANQQSTIDTAPRGIEASKPVTKTDLAARADRAQQFILANYQDPDLTIARVSREACLSPFHLIRVFKALTGQTPIQYLQIVRMTASRRLLMAPGSSVTEVASSVGYSDRTAFARAFRRRFGEAPSSLRNQS